MKLILAALLLPLVHAVNISDTLTVKTLTGVYTGLQNQDYPHVREFRSIPYAQPPLGSRRWLPPESLPPSNKHHYSTKYPPSCPQFVSNVPSLWNSYTPALLITNGRQNHTSGFVAESSSEDCLSLAIWTPYNVSADTKLPVAFFMTGGGFATGGVDIPGQVPASWVERSQEHIVVTINYRVNIFGFPNARALDDQNIGVMDQRMALEWVAENIAAFGGDPAAITMWGQSAGSMSTDYHNYAYWDNPISRATISQSGTAQKPLANTDSAQTNFTFVAQSLGCDFEDPYAEIDCMRQVPMAMIENFVGQYGQNGTKPSMSFTPIADEKIIFSNYTARAAEGKIAQIPGVLSNCANEDTSLYTWPTTNTSAGPYLPAVEAATLKSWVCPTANTSLLRDRAGLTTYRYQYAGNWSNQDPFAWLGAYHASDLVMNFGTYNYSITGYTGGPSEAEIETSQVMQDHLLAFVKDPVNGPQSVGWYPYHYGSNLLRFGAEGIAVQNVSGYDIDGPCFGNGTYDFYP